jgi:hypothetical protein
VAAGVVRTRICWGRLRSLNSCVAVLLRLGIIFVSFCVSLSSPQYAQDDAPGLAEGSHFAFCAHHVAGGWALGPVGDSAPLWCVAGHGLWFWVRYQADVWRTCCQQCLQQTASVVNFFLLMCVAGAAAAMRGAVNTAAAALGPVSHTVVGSWSGHMHHAAAWCLCSGMPQALRAEACLPQAAVPRRTCKHWMAVNCHLNATHNISLRDVCCPNPHGLLCGLLCKPRRQQPHALLLHHWLCHHTAHTWRVPYWSSEQKHSAPFTAIVCNTLCPAAAPVRTCTATALMLYPAQQLLGTLAAMSATVLLHTWLLWRGAPGQQSLCAGGWRPSLLGGRPLLSGQLPPLA